MPERLTHIGNGVFSRCSGLKSVDFPASLEYIGYSAFSYCESLKSAVFPVSLRHIADWAFGDCSGLESVDFQDSLEYIGEIAFEGCSNLLILAPHGLIEHPALKSIPNSQLFNRDDRERVAAFEKAVIMLDTPFAISVYQQGLGEEIRGFVTTVLLLAVRLRQCDKNLPIIPNEIWVLILRCFRLSEMQGSANKAPESIMSAGEPAADADVSE